MTAPKKANGRPVKTMTIGVVLDTLAGEFSDITISKIRFLENEGLITPQRTAAGYRRFTAADVDRLRYILTAQRDQYLPLKVIREQLEAMDSGAVTALVRGSQIFSPDTFAAPTLTRLTAHDVAIKAGCQDEEVVDLKEKGLITPDASGYFTADDVHIVVTALALQGFGCDLRLLKQVQNTAAREAELITRVAGPNAHSAKGAAKLAAEETMQQLSALVVSLHAAYVKESLRRGV